VGKKSLFRKKAAEKVVHLKKSCGKKSLPLHFGGSVGL